MTPGNKKLEKIFTENPRFIIEAVQIEMARKTILNYMDNSDACICMENAEWAKNDTDSDEKFSVNVYPNLNGGYNWQIDAQSGSVLCKGTAKNAVMPKSSNTLDKYIKSCNNTIFKSSEEFVESISADNRENLLVKFCDADKSGNNICLDPDCFDVCVQLANIYMSEHNLGVCSAENITFAKNSDSAKWAYIEKINQSVDGGKINVSFYNAKGEAIIFINGIKFKSIDSQNEPTQADNALDKSAVKENIISASKNIIGKLMNISVDKIDEDDNFKSFGFDSISFIELAGAMNGEFSVELTPDVFFRYSTIRSLTDYLIDELNIKSDSPSSSSSNVVNTNISENIESDSDVAEPDNEEFTENLSAKIVSIISDLMKIPEERVETDESINHFGFDSISIIELAVRLNEELNVMFTPDMLFSYDTVEKITQYLCENHFDEMKALLAKKTETVKAEEPEHNDEVPVDEAEISQADDASDTNVPSYFDSQNEKELFDDSRKISKEPVAIIGTSGRFPDARTVEEFWNILYENKEVTKPMPKERTEWNKVYDGADEKTKSTKSIGVIPGVSEFEPLFFEINPFEAENMDPRQRIVLEEIWRALENAGYGSQKIKNEKIGIFLGAEDGDYKTLVSDNSITSNSNAVMAARLAYFLNLDGPNMCINTACSSALVAVHEACLSLWNNECDTAIVAGANILTVPDGFFAMEKSGMLAADGKCRAFDKKASGMVPAEAVAVIVLKKLNAAQRDNDHIYASIIGSGINYDGKTNGITAPNGQAQVKLIKNVYDTFNIDPSDISYVVTHGTGTKLGDPIEINALTDVYKSYTDKTSYCALTSTKSNIGHSMAASGLVSLISLVMSMRKEVIPATINCDEPNDYIHWNNSPFYLNLSNKEWKDSPAHTRKGCVSAFGFSGTNAHVVVESCGCEREEKEELSNIKKLPCYLMTFSAKTEESLKLKLSEIKDVLENNDINNGTLEAICYTLLEGRQHFNHRCAIVAKDVKNAVELLQKAIQGDASDNIFYGELERKFKPKSDISKKVSDIASKINRTSENFEQNTLKLAEYYCGGYETAIYGIFGKQKPIELPGYPFLREKYWAEKKSEEAVTKLHTFVHKNISDFDCQSYSSVFDGNEVFFKEHIIGGRKILPGVAYLELAREAVFDASGYSEEQENLKTTFKNVGWFTTVDVSDENQTVDISLYEDNQDDIEYEIYTGSGDEEVINSQGKISVTEVDVVPQENIENIKEQCSTHISSDDCYKKYEQMDMKYGDTFKCIRDIYVGNNISVAKLVMPSNNIGDDVYIHTGMLDGALQSIIGMNIADGSMKDLTSPSIPFALNKAEVFKKCTDEMWAIVRKTSPSSSNINKYNVSLCDEAGNVCIKITEYASRTMEAKSNNSEQVDTALLCKNWTKTVGTEKDVQFAKRYVVVCNMPKTYAILSAKYKGDESVAIKELQSKGKSNAEKYSGYAVSLFNILKDFFNSNKSEKVLLQLVYNSKSFNELNVALGAELKTACLERPNLFFAHSIGITNETNIAEILDNEKEFAYNGNILYKDGERYIETISEFEPDEEIKPIWKDNGVYVITGGTGGLGTLFAKEIADNTENSKIILTGRKKPDSKIQTIIDSIDGSKVSYVQMDVTNKVSVKNAVEKITGKYGKINGIIHSAGIIRDNYIIRKTDSEFKSVLQPKVLGVEYLDEATKKQPLDFMILFSSTTGSNGNAGQADYAAANAFMDIFSKLRNAKVNNGTRFGRTLAINWPLWKDGGMAVDSNIEKIMEDSVGMSPMPAKQGIAALKQAWSSNLSEVICVSAKKKNLSRLIDNISEPKIVRKEEVISTGNDNISLSKNKVEELIKKIFADTIKLPLKSIDAKAPLEEYGIDSIMAMRLTNELEKVFGSLPKTLFFEYQTISELSKYFIEEYADKLSELINTDSQNGSGVTAKATKSEISVFLRDILAKRMKLQPNKVGIDVPMEEYGIDSIMAMQLTNELENVFGSLPKTLFFEYQTIGELSNYFEENYSSKIAELIGKKAVSLNNANSTKSESESYQPKTKRHRRRRNTSNPKSNDNCDIAIIGLAGKYPKANDIHTFWENLKSGLDCITEIPEDRWEYESYFNEDKNNDGTIYCKWGGFIDGVDEFDPLFFNITPKEAEIMEPQERLFLECVYHAMEDAGYTRQKLAQVNEKSGNVGVYVGVMYEEYQLYAAEEEKDGHMIAVSSNPASIANRISYYCNLHGPSMSIDTMCSSSLTAIHLACQSLKQGECEVAIAGGVNVSIHQHKYVMLSQGKFASAKGRCASFGEGGDGYVPGEGVGAIILKPLDKAVQDGDNIYAVIKGTAVNHGGKTNGYTVPNPNAQSSLIDSAIKASGLNPRIISYVEAHGTGTSLGDPIEIQGLTKAFKNYTNDKQFCRIGSVKSNIGHCESAAGIAGLTKILLQMKYKKLVPSIHSDVLNSYIDFAGTPFVVQKDLSDWERPVIEVDGTEKEFPRTAGISAFGAGGSNAHVILQEYNKKPNESETSDNYLIVLSAKNEKQLNIKAKELSEFIAQEHYSEDDMRSIAYTLQVGREAMDYRLAFTARNIAELSEKLLYAAGGDDQRSDIFRGNAKKDSDILALIEKDLSQWINNLLADKKYDEILDLWAKGADIDWNILYDGHSVPNKISLSGYPFDNERYWIPQSANSNSIGALKAALHPLVQENTSDLNEQKYSSHFTGNEAFLAGHKIYGEKILPGAVYLEMACFAALKASNLEYDFDNGDIEVAIRNIGWFSQFNASKSNQINISLIPDSDSGMKYEIYTENSDSEDIISNSQGYVTFSDRANESKANVNISELLSQCGNEINTDECYKKYSDIGIEYSNNFRCIDKLCKNNNTAVAHLTMPKSNDKTAYILHPSIIDGAFQTVIAFYMDNNDSQAKLPFAIDDIKVYQRTKESVWVSAIMQSTNGQFDKYDITLYDENGNVCVEIKGYTARAVSSDSLKDSSKLIIAADAWSEKTLNISDSQNQYDKYISILCDFDSASANRIKNSLKADEVIVLSENQSADEKYKKYALAVFEEIKNILSQKQNVFLQFVYTENIEDSGIFGMLKSVEKETPYITAQAVEWSGSDNEKISKLLYDEYKYSTDAYVKLDGKARYIKTYQKTVCNSEADKKPWKDDGVYLITGGAGGIGMLFAKEIAVSAPKAKIIITGRSASKQGLAQKLGLDADSQNSVSYVQTDVTDIKSVENTIQNIISKYGKLNGIIHSAGVIKDNYAIKKSSEEFLNTLSPKVSGVVNLDTATKDIPLDFMVYFSSVSGTLGNAGQLDYAAANAFMDAFAHHRQSLTQSGKRSGKTVSICWPLWKDGGMQVDEAVINSLSENGIELLDTENAFSAFYFALDSNNSKNLVLYGSDKKLGHLLQKTSENNAAEVSRQTLPANTTAESANEISDSELLERTSEFLKKLLSENIKLPVQKIDSSISMEEYGIDSVMTMQMTNQLEKTFGSLPKTLFFEYQTIDELSKYFIEKHADKLSEIIGVSDDVKENITTAIVTEHKPTASLKNRMNKSRFIQNRSGYGTNQTDIAIVGLAGRYPKADNITEFWNNLSNGVDCVTEIPNERWDYKLYFDSNKNKPGKVYSKWGGFINHVFDFDPLFFNISPREAELMEPQERLFLECVYEAMEDAGYTRNSAERNVGVYVGTMYEEYQLYAAQEQLKGNMVAVNGTASSIANRVSYYCNFNGPSMVVDTMCSSSLTAIHLACQSIKNGECDAAIAGGVNVSIHPNKFLVLSQGKFASAKGRCAAFGEGGDGYVPGEGVGAVLLKPVDKAIKDGDHIYGVIKATAVNHGGKTNGYTVPNPIQQTNVISKALKQANVDAGTIGYIEAHGTGTSLGDPIEITGLTKAFEEYTDNKQFCKIGSVKSNIGHCESAAGIASLTKVLMQMKYGKIAPSLHSEVLNPYIDFKDTPFVVSEELSEWKRQNNSGIETPRRAGISAFGAGGSNAHIIVEEYIDNRSNYHADNYTAVILLSAKTFEQVKEQAARLKDCIFENHYTDDDLLSISYTLATGREAMNCRIGFAVSKISELVEKLNEVISPDKNDLNIYKGEVNESNDLFSIIDKELERTVDDLIEHSRYEKLLDIWTRGYKLDWTKLYKKYGTVKKLSLPTYPFANEEYSIPKITEYNTPAGTSYLHPLLQENTSDFNGIKFTTKIKNTDKNISQYILNENMSDMAYIEMAAKAISLIVNVPEQTLKFEEVIWGEPVKVDKNEKELNISLNISKPNNYEWVVYQNLNDEQVLVACKGKASVVPSGKNIVPALSLSNFNRETKINNNFGGAISRAMANSGNEILLEINLNSESENNAVQIQKLLNIALSSINGSSVLSGTDSFMFSSSLDSIKWITIQKTENGCYNIAAYDNNCSPVFGFDGANCVGEIVETTIDYAENETTGKASIQCQETNQNIAHNVNANSKRTKEMTGWTVEECVLWEVKKLMGSILKIKPEKISSYDNLNDFGFDSLTIVEFAGLMSEHFEANVTPDVFYSYYTADKLKDFLCDKYHDKMEEYYGESSPASAVEPTNNIAPAPVNTPATAEPQPVQIDSAQIASDSKRTAEMTGMTVQECIAYELKKIIADVLKLKLEKINADQYLENFGFESMSLVEFSGAIEELFDIRFTPDLIYSYPTVNKISEYLSNKYSDKMNKLYAEADIKPQAVVSAPSTDNKPTDIQITTKSSRKRIICKQNEIFAQSAFVGGSSKSFSENSPIAIVGMSGKFPEADNVDEFWNLIKNGKDVIAPVKRKSWEKMYADEPEKASMRTMGALSGIDEFDPLFFEISPRDAESMDPRQRILLQETWKALENAGYFSKNYTKERVGLFVGAEDGDYNTIIGDDAAITSNHNAVLAARLAYILDMKGPNMTINTACSAGLVAVHEACQSLRCGECDTAIVAGVNILTTPVRYLAMEKSGMLSKDGKCYAFDKRANGMVPGEAVAVVVLRRLDEAKTDNNSIYATIVGSAINYDGKTNGITAPNGKAQSQLLKDTYSRFNINPEDISYIVTHGTGTKLGDPIELNALTDTFKEFTDKKEFCALTSVKPNIGHTMAASGVVSLISLVKAMNNNVIPPSIHCEQENDYINTDERPFYINKSLKPWTDNGDKRRLGCVSAFGFSGTNAHIVVQSYKSDASNAQSKLNRPYYLLVFSAKNKEALTRRLEDMALALESRSDMDNSLDRVSYSLIDTRKHFTYRCAIVVRDKSDAVYMLRQAQNDIVAPNIFYGNIHREFKPKVSMGKMVDELAKSSLSVVNDARKYQDILYSLAELYCSGYENYLDGIWGGETLQVIDIPTYPFSKEKYWVEDAVSKSSANLCPDETQSRLHPLVHENISNMSEQKYKTHLSDNTNGIYLDKSGFVSFASQAEMVRVATVMAVTQKPKAVVIKDLVPAMPMKPESDFFTNIYPINNNYGCTIYQETENESDILKNCEAVAEIAESCRSGKIDTNNLGSSQKIGNENVYLKQSNPDSGEFVITINNNSSDTSTTYTHDCVIDTGAVNKAVKVLEQILSLSISSCNVAKISEIYVQNNSFVTGSVEAEYRKSKDNIIYVDINVYDSDKNLANSFIGIELNSSISSDFAINEVKTKATPEKSAGTNRTDEMNGMSVLQCINSDVKSVLGKLLKLNTDIIGNDDSFESFGVDSISMVELAGALSDKLEIEITPDVFYSYPNVRELSKYFAEEYSDKMAELYKAPSEDTPKEPVSAATSKTSDSKQFVSGKLRISEMSDMSVKQCIIYDIKKVINDILKLPIDKMDINDSLQTFGFDSINLVELAAALSEKYDLEITPDMFFSYSSIKSIAEYLITEHSELMNDLYGESVAAEQSDNINDSASNISSEQYIESKNEKFILNKNTQAKSSADNIPIAVVGMSGKFPAAKNIEELWNILFEGREVISRVPEERTEWQEMYSDCSDEQLKSRKMGVLPDIGEFDPQFFKISPREAISIDPRQRIMLEEMWKALEDAGYGKENLSNEKVGVFVGAEEGDYRTILSEELSITSNHNAVLAARLAYLLNLKGPNMAINTACSSSLVAIHQACLSLRNGECDTAIVAGANILTTPGTYKAMENAGMLSADGKCYAFDKRANGMVPAEAVAAVVLKRLDKAQEDKNPIYATVIGSGINYDGKTNGITAPSGSAQTALLKEVYDKFAINPEDISYIVTHGTGTNLGDPIEINSLANAFKKYTTKYGFCALTSTKPNIGHALAASGIVSFISLVMSMYKETIPQSINCEQVNEYIHWKDSPFFINRENKEWKDSNGKKRIAGVSAFGMSGTNAHIVLQSYDEQSAPKPKNTNASKPEYLMLFSAKSQESLTDRLKDLLNFVNRSECSENELASASYTLMKGRQHFNLRTAIVAKNKAELVDALQAAILGEKNPNVYIGSIKKNFNADEKIQNSLNDAAKLLRTKAMDEMRYKKALTSLAEFYCIGYDEFIDNLWDNNIRLLRLPTYPFRRKKYWPKTLAKKADNKQTLNNAENKVNAKPENTQVLKPKAKIKSDLDNKVSHSVPDSQSTVNKPERPITLDSPSVVREKVSKTTTSNKLRQITLDSPKPTKKTNSENLKENSTSSKGFPDSRTVKGIKELQMLYPKKKPVTTKSINIKPLVMLTPKSRLSDNTNAKSDEINGLNMLYPKKKDIDNGKYNVSKPLKLLYPNK